MAVLEGRTGLRYGNSPLDLQRPSLSTALLLGSVSADGASSLLFTDSVLERQRPADLGTHWLAGLAYLGRLR